MAGESGALTPPNGEASPRITRRPRVGLRFVLASIAILAVLLALSLRYVLGGGDVLGADSVAVEFVNSTDHTVRELSIDCSGGRIGARELKPGESVRGRVWPAEVTHLGESYDCKFEIRLVGLGGRERGWSPEIGFSPEHYVPKIRWVLADRPDDPEALVSEGMTDKPSPQYIRDLRHRLGR